MTRLNRSSNRRPRSLVAHWCSLVWIFSTRRSAAYSSASCAGSSVFTVVLLAFQSPSAANSLGPFAMWPVLPASDYYGPSVPSRAVGRRWACPPPPWPGGRGGRSGTVPTFTDHSVGGVGARLCPCSLAMGTPQAFPMASPPATQSGFGVAVPAGTTCTAARPTSTRLEPVPSLRGFCHRFTRVAPFRLACRTRAVWWCRPVPSLSGLLPALPGTSRVRLPSASPACCDRPAVGPYTPPD